MEFNHYQWKEANTDISEKAYMNMNRDLVYIEDRYTGQTNFDDFDQDRYAVVLNRNYNPPGKEETLHETMDWNEAEAFLESKVNDFQ